MSAPVEPRRRGVVPPLSPEAARAVLASPRLPAAAAQAAAVAREAAALALPVRLETPTAAGRTLLARALHALGGRSGPLVAAEGRCRALHGLPPGASVLVDLEAVTVPAASILEALLDDGSIWLLVGTVPGQALPPVLAARLDTVTLRIPPLGQRTGELPAIAAHVSAALGARRGTSPPPFSPDALAWLAAQPWPGDLPELEAVVARALLRAGDEPITAAHLSGEEAVAREPAGTTGADDRARLEYLAAEMAHELKNPLVTIKTFADHLPTLVDDAELRARFAGLANESIARMDELLENVLAFARMGAPQPAPVEIGPLLDGVVADPARARGARRHPRLRGRERRPAQHRRRAARLRVAQPAGRDAARGAARRGPARRRQLRRRGAARLRGSPWSSRPSASAGGGRWRARSA